MQRAGFWRWVVALVFSSHLVHGQLAATDETETFTDFEVMLRAIIESTPPVPASSIGEPSIFRGFYSAQHAEDWPPYPGNIFGLDVWVLGEGFYVFDDRNIDYAQLAALNEKTAKLSGEPTVAARGLNANQSIAYSAADALRPYLTNLISLHETDFPVTASFDIAGGTNGVPYDILTSTNLVAPLSEWQWLGIGYAEHHYTFTNQPYDLAFYALTQPHKTMTVSWGNNAYGEGDVPLGLTNAVQVAGGNAHSLALLRDGTVVAWGVNNYGQTNVPAGATNVTMITSGQNHCAALLTNGTVLAWGHNGFPYSTNVLEVPADLTNAVAIAAGSLHTLALRDNGQVVAWGYSGMTGVTNVPADLTNVVAIAAGHEHNLVVTADGLVSAWGNPDNGRCTVPSGLSNVWDVAAGPYHSMALKRDGTVVCWGGNSYGESTVPEGLSNVVAIVAGGHPTYASRYSLALTSDGQVVAWGSGEVLYSVAGLSNVIAIGGGAHHALAVRTGPATPVVVYQPANQYQVAGGAVTFWSRAQGVYGVSSQWQHDGVDLTGETNATLTLTNVQSDHEGVYRVVVSNEVGTLTSSNASFYLVTPPEVYSKTPATNPTVYYQTVANLSVTAAGIGQANGFPISYQWRFNGTNISEATAAAYSFFATNGTEGQYSVTVSNAAGSTNVAWDVAINFGTLAYYLSTNTAAYTNGYTGSSSDMSLLANWTPAKYTNGFMGLLTNAVWSTNCWLKGVHGLSATAVGISNNYGGQWLLTMVSPRHYLRASHVGTPFGMIAFMDTNNVIHWRTFLEQVEVGNDTDVGILNEDLPSSVGYLPVLPSGFTNYLPTSAYVPVQGIGMNQDQFVFGQPVTFEDPVFVHWNAANMVPFGLTTNWNVMLRPGDSSLPERILIDGRLILVTQHFHAFDGPNLAFQFDAINQKMHYLSTNQGVTSDYQLTTYSLTNWPSIR